MEVREYRDVSKKLVEVEERGKLLTTLINKKLGFNEEESFVQKEVVKLKSKGDN